MIKQQSSPTKTIQKINLVDGPPLDFSFKNIRNLQELGKMVPSSGGTEALEQSAKNQLFLPKTSQKEIGENNQETRLNIMRTIEVQQSKKDIVKQLVLKKENKLANKIVQKTQIRTTSLFLRYNKLRSAEGILETVQHLLPGNKFEQLLWIDFSHNRLTNISKEFTLFPQLKNLYLHVNFISDYKQFDNLKGVELLRTFTIHGNPIEKYPEFRALLTCILPQLQKIDSTLLTKREKERGEVIRKQGGKYPLIANPSKVPEESEQQDQN